MNNYGKIIIHSYDVWNIYNPKVKVYCQNQLIGEIARKEIWSTTIKEDTILTLKILGKKTDVEVKSNKNNVIHLSYGSKLIANVEYTDEDVYVENAKFTKHLKNVYLKRRCISIGCFLLALFLFFKIDDFGIIVLLFILPLLYISLLYKKPDKWKHLSGPKIPTMDEGYDIKIRTILFPRLQKYMYMMSDPVSDHPGHQTYTGFYKKHRINFTFFNAHKKMTNINNYKYPMLLVVDYPDNNIFNLELGEIDLCNEENVNKAVELIVKSLNLEPRIIHYEGGELMNTYLVKYFVGNSSSTTTEEEVSANSEYNAKELIIARYPNQEVHILNITKIN